MDCTLGTSLVSGCDRIYVHADRLHKDAHFFLFSSSVGTEGVAQLLINHARQFRSLCKSALLAGTRSLLAPSGANL